MQRPPAWFALGVLALLAVRAFHLGPQVDGPNVWRQMDTAQYVRSFVEDGIDLLRPSVCWMGSHRTVVLECPWPEALAALAQRGASPQDLRPSRLVFLAFFLLAWLGFHAAARSLVGLDAARLASLLYLASPLAQFYSRALHVDFAALAGAHGMLALWLSGLARGSPRRLLAGSLLGVLGALVKAPYLLPPLLALLPALLAPQRRGLALRSAPLLLLPALCFAGWRAHAEAINAAVPDWSFLPDYHPMTGMSTWYLGTLAQRLDPHAWAVLLRDRLLPELLGPLSLPLAGLGLGLLRGSPGRAALLLWSGGAALHVLLFFNLNVVHDYYQLPLLAPLALLAALPLQRARDTLPARLRALPLLVLAGLAIAAVAWAERHGYQRQPGFEAAGAAAPLAFGIRMPR